MKKNPFRSKMYRQGDVLLVPCDIPEDASPVDTADRVVLAEGELTGHFHALPANEHITLYQTGDQRRFLHLDEELPLTHDEHDTIMVKAGNYRIIRQREYEYDLKEARQEARRVAD